MFRLLLLVAAVCRPELVSADNKLLVLLIDAFRWNYFDKFGPNELPGFTRLRETGVSAEAFVPSFPSLSHVNYYSIMTGLHPESHGMIDNYMYDPIHKTQFLAGLNEDQYKSYWWDDGEPLWVTAERQGKRSYWWYWMGCEVEIRGYRPTFCSTYQSTSPYPDVTRFALGLDLAVEVLKNGTADLAGVYLETVDKYGHGFGPNSAQLKEAIRSLDRELVRLLDALNASSDINVMLFSDHGMSERFGGPADSTSSLIDIRNYINATDWANVMSGGPVFQLWPQPGKEDWVYERLRTAHDNMTVYKKQDIPERYHLKNHYRVPPLYFVADEGYAIVWDAYTEGLAKQAIGHHGFDNVVPNMHGIFMAVGPDFKQNATFKVGRLPVVEAYQLMCYVMNITASPNNGSWSNVYDVLAGGHSLTIDDTSSTRTAITTTTTGGQTSVVQTGAAENTTAAETPSLTGTQTAIVIVGSVGAAAILVVIAVTCAVASAL